MPTPEPLPLNRLDQLTQDYARMLNRSTGLCSLWTGLCQGGLTLLAFAWTWQHYVALGRPEGHYLRFMLRTHETLPFWILAIAFLLPLFWAPVMRGLSTLVYPERFGTVRAKAPEWTKGLEALEGPWARWIPLLFLAGVALYATVLRPLMLQALGDPSGIVIRPWRVLLAPLLGLVWVGVHPRLRKAEASEGTVLVYIAGFMLTGWDLQLQFILLPVYALLTLGTIAYGLWAHTRYKRSLTTLETLEPEVADA